MHHLLLAIWRRSRSAGRRAVLLPVLVEVERLPDGRRVVVLRCLRVHGVLCAHWTDPKMVGREDQRVVAARTRGRGLDLQVWMCTLRVVAARLLLGV